MIRLIRGCLAVLIMVYFVAALLIPLVPFYPGARKMTEAQRKQINQTRKDQHTQRPQHRG